jgi:hypothetical protein
VAVDKAPVQIRIRSEADYNQASTALSQAQRGEQRQAGAIVVIEEGTYTRHLQLTMRDMPMDLTVRGEGEVVFENTSMSLSGQSISVEGIAFTGRVSTGAFLRVIAAGDVAISDVKIADARIGATYTPSRLPSKPGEKRRRARGAKPRPSFLVQVQTTGPGLVQLKDLNFANTKLIGSALIDVHARPAREVVVEGLSVVDTPAPQIVRVSAGTTVITR